MNLVNIPSKHGGGKHLPTKVVIHSMAEFIEAGEIDYYAKDLLDLMGLSAHYLVTPSGVIIQCRNDDQVGWHAKGHNLHSIGVEVLVAGVHTYETFIERIKTPYIYGDQYTALIELCKTTFKGLEFVRHSDISPGRKFDPGDGLDWKTFLNDVK